MLYISNENVTEDPNEIPRTFNSYFSTIGANLTNELPDTSDAPESYVTPSNSTFQIQNVFHIDVYRHISSRCISFAYYIKDIQGLRT